MSDYCILQELSFFFFSCPVDKQLIESCHGSLSATDLFLKFGVSVRSY